MNLLDKQSHYFKIWDLIYEAAQEDPTENDIKRLCMDYRRMIIKCHIKKLKFGDEYSIFLNKIYKLYDYRNTERTFNHE